jgi:two-component system sensor histidine kinase YesM
MLKNRNVRPLSGNDNFSGIIDVKIIPIIAIALLATIITSTTIFYHTIISKTKAYVKSECNLVVNRLSKLFENLITCSNVLVLDINTAYLNTEPYRVNKSIYNVLFTNQIRGVFEFALQCFPELDSIVFIDTAGSVFQSGLVETPEVSHIPWTLINLISERSPPITRFFHSEDRPFFQSSKQEPMLTLGKRLIDIRTGETIGVFFLNIRESVIADLFPENITQENYFLINSEGKVLAARDKSAVLHSIFEDDIISRLNSGKFEQSISLIKNKLYLLSPAPLSDFNLFLVSRILYSYLTRGIYLNMFLAVIIGTAAILLTHTSMKEHTQKRRYELALIHEQIKPHFLYNALDLIFVFCRMNKNTDAASTTKALAGFYRGCLSGGSDIVSIADEINMIRSYLIIQEKRYSDHISFVINVDSALDKFAIPKMTLQPLVENAIYHGLRKKDECGLISVNGYLYQDYIELEVCDNGVGMVETMIEKILRNKTDPVQKSGFGLYNVNERIKLYLWMEIWTAH